MVINNMWSVYETSNIWKYVGEGSANFRICNDAVKSIK